MIDIIDAPKKEIATEEDLLERLNNVQFKPFYEETNDENTCINLGNGPKESFTKILEQDIGVNFTAKAQPKPSITDNIKARRTINDPSVNKYDESTELKCLLDGESFSVINEVKIDDSKGCYLAKNAKGYFVLAYTGDKITKLKRYDNITTEKIYLRETEKISESESRYIVKAGLNKFIIKTSVNQIEFLMDL